MSETMKIIDEKERQKGKFKKNKQMQKGTRVDRRYSERVRAKWFCWAYKLDFFQLICTSSVICKSNLELALWITLKQRELYESEHVTVKCRCLKYETCYSLFFLICSSILILKGRQVSPI